MIAFLVGLGVIVGWALLTWTVGSVVRHIALGYAVDMPSWLCGITLQGVLVCLACICSGIHAVGTLVLR